MQFLNIYHLEISRSLAVWVWRFSPTSCGILTQRSIWKWRFCFNCSLFLLLLHALLLPVCLPLNQPLGPVPAPQWACRLLAPSPSETRWQGGAALQKSSGSLWRSVFPSPHHPEQEKGVVGSSTLLSWWWWIQLITEFTDGIVFLSFLVWRTCTTYPDRHLKFGGWGAPSIRTSPVRPAGSFLAASISRNLKENSLAWSQTWSLLHTYHVDLNEKCSRNMLSCSIRARQKNSRWLPTSCCSHDGVQAGLHNPTIINSREITVLS